jgi:hypothetical protein
MQTFITHADTNFSLTAHELDNKRLNKQALEAWQIMMTNLKLDPEGNHREPKGWYNHPAVKLWRGHEPVLFEYICAMTMEWVRRGFKTTIDVKAFNTLAVARDRGLLQHLSHPDWMRDLEFFSKFVSSHRTALLVKDYDWYHKMCWSEDPGHRPETYEYIWTNEGESK